MILLLSFLHRFPRFPCHFRDLRLAVSCLGLPRIAGDLLVLEGLGLGLGLERNRKTVNCSFFCLLTPFIII